MAAAPSLATDTTLEGSGDRDPDAQTAAATVAAAARLTIVGELIGRRVSALGRLVEATDAHPTLAGVDTIRLTSLAEPTNRLLLVAGVKWNLAATWLLGASILRPLTSSGLNAEWMPTVTFDYSF